MTRTTLKTRVEQEFKEEFAKVAESSDKSQAEALRDAVRLWTALESGGATAVATALQGDSVSLDTADIGDDDDTAETEDDSTSEYAEYSIETVPPIAPGEADFGDTDVVPESSEARLTVLQGMVDYIHERDGENSMEMDEFEELIKEQFGVGRRTAKKYVEEATSRGIIYPHISVHHDLSGGAGMRAMKDTITRGWQNYSETAEGGLTQRANARYVAYDKCQSTRELSSIYKDDVKGLVSPWFDQTRMVFFDQNVARSVARATLEGWAEDCHALSSSGVVFMRAARLAISDYDLDADDVWGLIEDNEVRHPEALLEDTWYDPLFFPEEDGQDVGVDVDVEDAAMTAAEELETVSSGPSV